MYKIPHEYLYKDSDGFYKVKNEYYKPVNNEQKLNEFTQGLFAIRQLINTPSLLKQLKTDLQTEYERKAALREIIRKDLGKVHDEINRILKVAPEFIATKYFSRLNEIMSDYNSVLVTCMPTEDEYKEYLTLNEIKDNK